MKGFLIIIMNRLRKRGQLLALSFGLYAAGRFLTEFIRGDYINFFMGGLTISQVFCLVLIPASVGLFIYFGKHAETIELPATESDGSGDKKDDTSKE